jgi:hypothetical protein
MLRLWRQIAAPLLLVVAVSPPLLAALVTLHIEHHAGHGHHKNSFGSAASIVIHGHYHDGDTPEHGHYATSPVFGPPPAKLQVAVLPAVILRALAATASGPARNPEALSGCGHDPPHHTRAVSILRI